MDLKYNSNMRSCIKKGLIASAFVVAIGGTLASADRDQNHMAFYIDMLDYSAGVEADSSIASDLHFSVGQIMSLSDLQSINSIAQTFEIQVLVSGHAPSFDDLEPDLGGGLGNQGRATNVHGAHAEPKTDNLNIVPLPPAAFAGLGLLVGIAGVRYMRNRK